ncbi:proline dehydrogenase family protein [Lysobacter korlensis]|uniref:Bifunctional protein PutA n=1 Tax=Lysobacter korlensis TaxID=553636 RepID=A0ABV6RP43_9GAMM
MTDVLDVPAVQASSTRALGDEAVEVARRWLMEAANLPVHPSARQLAGVLRDPDGLDFTVGFVDGVVRPEDLRVAARNLRGLGRKIPKFLPAVLRGAVALGGVVAPILPRIVIPIARAVLRRMVGHLLIDATDARLGRAIRRIRTPGVRLNMNLLGEAVLGEKEAARRLDGTRRLLERDDVDYVSIKVSSTVEPHSPWAFDEAVDDIVERLTPLYRYAASAPTPKFINLDMEEYKDLHLTIAVFQRLLDSPELKNLEAGIVLQAYLPDSLAAMIGLQEWAATRRAAGGAGIKVRLVKGANLPMEHVESDLSGWPVATWGTKQQTDTHYKRVLDYALHPERTANVRLGVAGHNLFDLAFAWLLAKERGVESHVEFEMLLGMAQGQAEAVKKDVGGLLLYTPVVHPQEFDVAIAYLIRRLEEGASSENFMSAVFELADNQLLFDREKQRFLHSLADLDDTVPGPNRTQDRTRPPVPGLRSAFENALDTDPSLPANRRWGRDILSRVPASRLGVDAVAAATIEDAEALSVLIAAAAESGRAWGARSGAERAAVLHRVGDALERRRAELMEVMAAEAGKTLDQSDPEVSEAVDFAHYYAELARELDAVDGAVFTPARLTVVTPPWNFPVAIPAGSVLAALAAGSAVILKPAHPAARCGAVLAEAMWEAGVPGDVLRLVQVRESSLGRELIASPSVDRVILTGAFETAELFRSFRPDLPLLAETSGKNAIVVTPSADLDLAAKDVAYSAFGHAGQKCSAASLVILVGSVADSRRFRSQLVDAVTSLKVGYPDDPATKMGPIIEPASGKLLEALTTLGPGESWLIEPRQLDDSGKLWSPGVREGVRRGSEFHRIEYFGPVLGVMRAGSLEEAVALQNDVDFGLTAGLHSLDRREVEYWVEHVQAGNLYVNRGITGAIVRRQPFGGWKKSSVGAGTKAGGPNYLVGLGNWSAAPSAASVPVSDPTVAALLEAAREELPPDAGYLERAARSDAAAWGSEFGVAKDASGLSAERNVLRYLPTRTAVRLAEGEPVGSLVRVLAAAMLASAAVTVSSAVPLPKPIGVILADRGIRVRVESDAAWLGRLARADDERLRLIGGSVEAVADATGGRPGLAVYGQPVTEAGRVELLPFLKEQAVSVTAHRFGNPTELGQVRLSAPVPAAYH